MKIEDLIVLTKFIKENRIIKTKGLEILYHLPKDEYLALQKDIIKIYGQKNVPGINKFEVEIYGLNFIISKDEVKI